MLSVVGAMVGYDNDVSNVIVDENIIHDDSERANTERSYCYSSVLFEQRDPYINDQV